MLDPERTSNGSPSRALARRSAAVVARRAGGTIPDEAGTTMRDVAELRGVRAVEPDALREAT
jgi:hypothetical protein